MFGFVARIVLMGEELKVEIVERPGMAGSCGIADYCYY